MATGNNKALINNYTKELLFLGEATTANSTLFLSCKGKEHFLNSKGETNKKVALKGDLKKAIRAALKKHFL